MKSINDESTAPYTLPNGVWYEEKYDRYRVRLHRKGEVEHLSYHSAKEDALFVYKTLRQPHESRLKHWIDSCKVFYRYEYRKFKSQ